MDEPKSHSLEADLATGWRPRLKIIGPMPLNFDNQHIDRILRPIISSETSLDEVVFLGNIYCSSDRSQTQRHI